MRNLLFTFTLWCLGGATGIALAETPLEIQRVTEGVYAIVGELDQRSAENYANNATFGLVVTDDGALLIDSGGCYRGAEQIDRAIRSITDQPVKIVINSGGQDHRWLGNGYFKARGARIITSDAALADQRARTNDHFNRLEQLLGPALDGTEPVYADETFENGMSLTFGGVEFRLIHAGPAHTVGDLFVWLPRQRVMFAGDIVFTERMLGTGPAGDSASWLQVFDTMMDYDPLWIVPGHGHVASPGQARADTRDYLEFLRQKVAEVIDAGGDAIDATEIDQSRFRYLKLSGRIARRNAQAIFTQMEFE
ncbi:MAG TPA: MBL fold metallo-hydrolase [Sedimenticola thiotaurini]|uniref:MBL fold metallo-hydrolase n=1 Tax=Sedimenticola thiotaurini TaxID=1543721 RepID=A0A831W4F3_9GAMM|nr:MBL fold metallo-hydrolase [Sedimenticola thiotaurini]